MEYSKHVGGKEKRNKLINKKIYYREFNGN